MPPSTVLDYALSYLRAGVSLLPVARDGTKGPHGPSVPQVLDPDTGRYKASWKPLQERALDEGAARRIWDVSSPPGVAAVCGAVSGGLEVLDFDALAGEVFPVWCALVEEEAPGLLDRLCLIKTPNGYHVWLRCGNMETPGNTKLATDPSAERSRRTLVETRGEGGYALVPGCPPECHPSGGIYVHHSGRKLEDLGDLSLDERDLLVTCARYFDRSQPDPNPPSPAPAGQPNGPRPGDDFDARGADWADILTPHGWTLAGTSGNERRWRRPDKKLGWSATTGHCQGKDGAELLRVFSSNADPFVEGKAYGKFRAYAQLNHAGDLSAAARDLAEKGYGSPRAQRRPAPATPPGPSFPPSAGAAPADPPVVPVVVVSPHEHDVVTQAVAALASDRGVPDGECVYHRGGRLVRVLRDSFSGTESLCRPPHSPVIQLLPRASLQEILSRVVRWERRVPGPDQRTVHIHPPAFAVVEIHERGNWPGLRKLQSVVETPTLRPDGTILETPGYDTTTSQLYEPSGEFPPVPQSPSRVDATRAADRLLDLVADFPFAGPAHKAAWLAAMLTPFARAAFSGCTPMFVFDASMAGSGKSLLADLISLVLTGRPVPRSTHPDNNEEMRKMLTSILLSGDRMLLLDNIPERGGLGCAALDAVLTSTMWKDRILGKTETTIDLPISTVFYATGNNVSLKGDMHRRVVPCRLQPLCERPEQRTGFRTPDIVRHVLESRGGYVRDALTVLRAHAVAGWPQADLPNLGSYEGWSRVVRQAVHWATTVDPCETRQDIQAADRGADELEALLAAWEAVPEAKEGLTIARLLVLANELHSSTEPLRSILRAMSRDKQTLPSSHTIGNRLRPVRGKVLNGRCLDSRTNAANAQTWYIRYVQ